MKDFISTSNKDYVAVRKCISDLTKSIRLNSDQIMKLASAFTDDFSEKASIEFADSHGLKAKIISGNWSELCHRDFPSIVKCIDGRLLLVLRASENSVLLYDQSEAKTSIVSKDIFLTRWSGYAITLQQKPKLRLNAGSSIK